MATMMTRPPEWPDEEDACLKGDAVALARELNNWRKYAAFLEGRLRGAEVGVSAAEWAMDNGGKRASGVRVAYAERLLDGRLPPLTMPPKYELHGEDAQQPNDQYRACRQFERHVGRGVFDREGSWL